MKTTHVHFLSLGLLCGLLMLACASSEEPALRGADPTLAGSGGASAGAAGEAGKAGGGQGGSSAGKGGAGQGGQGGQAGQAGVAGQGGQAGQAGAAGKAGAAGGDAGGAAGGGAGGAAGAACDPEQPPPGADCVYDTDCDLPPGLSPDCADMVCDVCGTWTCKVKAKNVGFGCSGANKCNEATCNLQGKCEEGGPKDCTSPDPCSEGFCNPETGACEFKPASEGLPCPSNDPCILNKTCQSGVCAGGIPKCQSDACRTASCSFGTCSYKAKNPAPSSCDDGDLCTENDVCVPDPDVASRCQGKPIQIDCSSFNQLCLKGVCDPKTGQCAAVAVNDGDACNDGLSCTSGDACSAGVCKGILSDLEHVFYEDFSENGKGWQLQGGWVIGEAKGSNPKPKSGNPDPTEDTTLNNSDNKLAGAVLGGNGAINQTKGGPWYLISPVIDLSGVEGPTFVQFRRWLNTGDPTSMTHTIEVFDGTAWQTIFTTVAVIKDNSWKTLSYDITGYKNAAFRIRFGYQVNSEKFDYTGWNIDDLVIGTPACDLGGGGTGGGGTAGQGGAGQGGGGQGGAGQGGAQGGAGQGGGGGGGAAGAGGQSGGGQGGAGGSSFVKVAGCTYEKAVDLIGASAMIQQVLLSYKPSCIRIKVGQTVTWIGEISKQPFKGMVGYGTQPNPIQGPYSTSPTEITFDAPGSYGFYSLIAGAEGVEDTGMSGAVFVEP